MQVNKGRIGIVTLYDLMNYGNRLQNYAVEEIVKSLGYQPKTIIIRMVTPRTIINEIIGRLKNRQQFQSWNMMQENKRFVKSLSTIEKEKYIRFLEFNKNNTHVIYKNLYKGFRCLWQRKYKYFLAGSDQIWNPMAGQAEDWEFLTFAPKNKRIAIAASFGVETISENRIRIQKNLQEIKCISVREEAGQKIVKELTGRDATLLVDPTLLITKEQWLGIAEKSNVANDNESYILTYFLGNETERIKNDIICFCNDKNLRVRKLNNKNDAENFISGPAEFLYMINKAELILTDSFHACVFAFLFNKPFLVYQRAGKKENMMSRMDTLLSKFSLERKYANSGLPNDIWEHDYTEGYKQLEIERKKAINFLKKALED